MVRTANAGIRLSMDDLDILLDGVCHPLYPYLGTPGAIREALLASPPHAVAFTHEHPDHYDEAYARLYKEKMRGSFYGPSHFSGGELGNGVRLFAVPTRHIGKTDIPHVSYCLAGSACVWFMGDASPLELSKMAGLPRPDVLVAPFAYAITPLALKKTMETGARELVILHMPPRTADRDGVWPLLPTVPKDGGMRLSVPEPGEELCFSL